MKNGTAIIAFLIKLLYAAIFSCMMLFSFPDLHGVSDVNWKHIAVLLITTVILSAAGVLNRRQQIYVAALSLFVFLFLFFSIGSERFLFYLGEEPGRVFLLTLVCYLVQPLLGKNIFLRMVSADITGGCMLYLWQVPKVGVVFFILYTALIAAEWIRLRWKKMKNKNGQAYILGILPFLFVYTVLLCFMPMKDEPYDWQWAKNLYRRAEEKIIMYTENLWNMGSEYFGGRNSGFSEEGGLFSGIKKNDEQLIRLGIGRQGDMSVYLAGKVFDSFNGREWENRREDSGTGWNGIRNGNMGDAGESERMLDVMETTYALRGYAGNLNLTFYRNVWMDVSYQYFHTNYLMAPSKTWAIEDGAEKIKYYYNGGNLIFDRKAGYGTEYMLRFCLLNMEREELYRFLEWNQTDDVVMWGKIVEQYTDESIPIEELYAYRETIKEYYLPKTDISPETEAWIADVTKDAKTDAEKLKFIESTLSGMAYNTNPGGLPKTVTDEKSFLDYFLLEQKEGYCVHFATAFVLLARAEGFPARYVQGFCIPEVSGDETPVYSDMAHAWPEVYIEGKGWIPFEPTPGFAVNRYLPETEDAESDTVIVYTSQPESRTQDHTPEPASEVSEEDTLEGNLPEEQEQNRILPYLIRAVWILIFGGILALVTDYFLEKYRDKRRGLTEKYRLTVLHNLQILDLLGYKREPFETYHELMERIDIPNKFIETFERHLYGTLEIDEQILHETLTEKAELLEILKKSKRKMYLFYRLRLYIVRYR